MTYKNVYVKETRKFKTRTFVFCEEFITNDNGVSAMYSADVTDLRDALTIWLSDDERKDTVARQDGG